MKKIFIILLPLAISACSIEPWVKPYEREVLADPIMQFAREPFIEKHFTHVAEVREASRGASLSAGGGCGCN